MSSNYQFTDNQGNQFDEFLLKLKYQIPIENENHFYDFQPSFHISTKTDHVSFF